MTEDAKELNIENKHSITLKCNAKGDYAWDIKLYFDKLEDDVSINNKLKQIDTDLRTKFKG